MSKAANLGQVVDGGKCQLPTNLAQARSVAALQRFCLWTWQNLCPRGISLTGCEGQCWSGLALMQKVLVGHPLCFVRLGSEGSRRMSLSRVCLPSKRELPKNEGKGHQSCAESKELQSISGGIL